MPEPEENNPLHAGKIVTENIKNSNINHKDKNNLNKEKEKIIKNL